MTKTLTEADLAGFTGSDHWYRHWLGRVLFTDGAKFLADAGGAYWLLDEIVFAQARRRIAAEEFQVWKLDLEGSAAKLTVEDGNGHKVWGKRIEFTDFPLKQITLWFTGNVILLPSEY